MAVGRFGRPHGLNGEVRFDPMGTMPGGLGGYTRHFIDDGAKASVVELDGWRPNGELMLMRVKGIKFRDEAAKLTGRTLYVERAELPPLEEGEYYHADLIGAAVLNGEGDELGRVADIKDWGDYDMLVIRTGSREWMLPVIGPYVVEVDAAGGKIIVAVPEGLGPDV